MTVKSSNAGSPHTVSETSNPMFTVSELSRIVRLSRASIQYYEKIGILNPDKADERHRYPESDVLRVTNAITLRNLGIDFDRIRALVDDDPFSIRHMEEYRGDLLERKDYLDAQITMLDRYIELANTDESAPPRIQSIEPYYFKPTIPWTAEAGTAEAGDEPMYMPISGGGAVFEGDDPLNPTGVHVGRTVPARFARLISGFGDTDTTIGGQTCLTCTWQSNIVRVSPCEKPHWDDLFARIKSHLAQHGLQPAGAAFIPYALSVYAIPRILVCLPVKRRGIFGHLRKRGSRT